MVRGPIESCRFGGKIGLVGILSGREAQTEIFPIVTTHLTLNFSRVIIPPFSA
jgi:hypothetical protein